MKVTAYSARSPADLARAKRIFAQRFVTTAEGQ
jgi:hypothetical protein